MNPSTEVRNAVLRLYESMGTGDVCAIERLFSCESGTLAIGTDPNEWWAGRDAIVEAFKAQLQGSGTIVCRLSRGLRWPRIAAGWDSISRSTTTTSASKK
jgi:hypothetical protein